MFPLSTSPGSTSKYGRAGDDAIATTVEYALLAGISTVIFLALGMAVDVFSATIEDDAVAIAAYGIAATVSAAASEATGPGDASAGGTIDLPERICGMPYLAYPSSDGREICVSVSGHVYRAPIFMQAEGVRITGFIASTPGEHAIRFDAATRKVIIS